MHTQAYHRRQHHCFAYASMLVLLALAYCPTLLAGSIYSYKGGHCLYEQANHLGNVLEVVSDKKTVATKQVAQPTIAVQHDYYPFGSALPQRSSGAHRFDFQGEESDSEWLNGAVVFKYRVHDTRVGRFLSVDPLAAKYAYNSPYAFSENRLIDGVELEGLQWEQTGKDSYVVHMKVLNSSEKMADKFLPFHMHNIEKALQETMATKGATVTLHITYVQSVDQDQDFFFEFVEEDVKECGIGEAGDVRSPEAMLSNYMQLNANALGIEYDGEFKNPWEWATDGAHEILHGAGLPHIHLCNPSANPFKQGNPRLLNLYQQAKDTDMERVERALLPNGEGWPDGFQFNILTTGGGDRLMTAEQLKIINRNIVVGKLYEAQQQTMKGIGRSR